jgi:undecaprenyl-diphosphatase
MIITFQAAVLGLLQGITELFPISSLGHSVILPRLFGWHLDQNAPAFLTFLIATHLATAIVLFVFFLRDWIEIFKGLGRSVRRRKIAPSDTYAKLGWLLIAGTIPAGTLVLFTAERLRHRKVSAIRVATASATHSASGTTDAESGRAQHPAADVHSDADISRLTWKQALGVGAAQTAALTPGISRSGSSMVGGLLSGLNNENAARFSFLLATPIIGAAALPRS